MISTVGGSLRAFQMLAGHSALSTTQRYVAGAEETRRRVVELASGSCAIIIQLVVST